jgi:hypothetical protein
MKNPVIVTGALMLALTVARPFAVQPAPTRLALELQDYAMLPITADNTNTNRRAQLARVNILRDLILRDLQWMEKVSDEQYNGSLVSPEGTTRTPAQTKATSDRSPCAGPQPGHDRRARRDGRRRPARGLPAPRSRERSDPQSDR